MDFGMWGPKMDLKDKGGRWMVVLAWYDGGGGMVINGLEEQ